ncbi:MAG: Gfo/Idh/MocA family oxidoreductase [Armatimonadetes bacterium]|nr:Gfo/Idh/MocA family oxidoreductase [Armatimonadota bacterium]
MNPLRVALVGCGIISEAHVRAYANHADRARITVCCDIDLEKAQERAEQAGGASVVTEYDEVISDPDVDAVEICTPHHLHKDAVIAAARAGKQVLCQKPLAKTLEDCDAMIAAAEEAGVTLYYGETNHTLPAALEAKRAIEAGRIGQIIGTQATYAHWQGGKYLSTAWRYDPNVTGGGQLLDGGIHYIDLMLNVAGPIEAVTCFATRFRPELGGEDTAVVNARYRGGHLGALFSSQAAGIWFPGASFIAFGTEGVLSMGGPQGALTLHRPDLPDNREALIEKGSWGDSFTVMIGHYLDTVQHGKPNPSPGSVGRENLKVVLAAYESARQGREVRLEEVEPQASPDRKA